MPETSKLEKLNWELEKSEKKLRKAINDEKALQYQLKQLRGSYNNIFPSSVMASSLCETDDVSKELQQF